METFCALSRFPKVYFERNNRVIKVTIRSNGAVRTLLSRPGKETEGALSRWHEECESTVTFRIGQPSRRFDWYDGFGTRQNEVRAAV